MNDPYSENADRRIVEEGVVGAIILNNEVLDWVDEEGISESDFSLPDLCILYAAARELIGRGAPADLITLWDALQQSGKLAEVGGIASISAILDRVPACSLAGHYARILKRRSADDATRRAIEAAMLEARNGNMPGAMAKISAAIQAVPALGQDYADMSTVAREVETRERLEMLPWGIGLMDRMLGGIPEGTLTVVGGYPGMGKSSFLLGMLWNAAAADVPAALYSLEMSRAHIGAIIAGRASGIGPSRILRSGAADLDEIDRKRLGEVLDTMRGKPLFIVAQSLSAEEIVASARKLWKQKQVRVVGIDYLQLIKTTASLDSRRLEIDHTMATLKALTQETDMAVIILSQLARGPEHGKNPRASLLKESGGILEAADIVLILDRPRFREWADCPSCGETPRNDCWRCRGSGQVSRDTELVVQVEKNRLGDVATLKLAWDGRLMEIREKMKGEEG